VLFNTLQYALFFGVVFVVSWLLAGSQRLRLLFFLLSSYVFYAAWSFAPDSRGERHPYFLLLIFLSSTGDWLLGNAIAGARSPRTKKLWLTATVILNLGVLGIFKYFDFGIESARSLLLALGFHPPDVALSIALPIGISFFTFESMS
jgi:alginate O-acetyltransferase complex protein AlgI